MASPHMSSAYGKVHTDRTNLAIHLLAVPVFVGMFSASVIAAAQAQFAASGRLLLVALLAFGAQAIGHRRETVPPKPFGGPIDFLQRVLAEQYYKFWRFLLSGELTRNWRQQK